MGWKVHETWTIWVGGGGLVVKMDIEIKSKHPLKNKNNTKKSNFIRNMYSDVNKRRNCFFAHTENKIHRRLPISQMYMLRLTRLCDRAWARRVTTFAHQRTHCR